MTVKYNILYLEHDDERYLIKNNLENNLDSVDVKVLSPDPGDGDKIDKPVFLNKIENALSQSNFDLVLTDAYFLPEDKEHPEFGDGDNCIKDVVELIQKISPSLKIVVYSHYKEDLIKDCKGLDIYDIWNKASTPPHYLTWRVEKTLKEPWNIVPGQLLVNTLKKYLLSKEKEVWEEYLLKLIENYSPQLTAHQNISDMTEELRDISLKLDLPTTKFQNMLNSFLKQDIMSLISSPQTWSHAKHVLNVFWLGYYILSSIILDVEEQERKIVNYLRLSENEKKDSRKFINRSWIVASLFHDFGLIGEKLNNLIENTNTILNEYPWGNDKVSQVKLQPSHSVDERKKLLEKHFEELKGTVGNGMIAKINDAWKKHLNHGILSAITIREKFNDTETKEINKSISDAAVACALHKLNFGKGEQIKYTEYPLACLLRFCDEIQTWERETGLETIEEPIWLQSIVLAEINKPDENSLNFRIEYIPRKDIGPDDSKNKSTRKELKRVLDHHTIPSLKSLDWTDSGIKLSVKFMFRGEQLESWKSS